MRAILLHLIFKFAGFVVIASYITIFISFALFPWGWALLAKCPPARKTQQEQGAGSNSTEDLSTSQVKIIGSLDNPPKFLKRYLIHMSIHKSGGFSELSRLPDSKK